MYKLRWKRISSFFCRLFSWYRVICETGKPGQMAAGRVVADLSINSSQEQVTPYREHAMHGREEILGVRNKLQVCVEQSKCRRVENVIGLADPECAKSIRL